MGERQGTLDFAHLFIPPLRSIVLPIFFYTSMCSTPIALSKSDNGDCLYSKSVYRPRRSGSLARPPLSTAAIYHSCRSNGSVVLGTSSDMVQEHADAYTVSGIPRKLTDVRPFSRHINASIVNLLTGPRKRSNPSLSDNNSRIQYLVRLRFWF